jgi:hypothetical protein
MTPDFIRFRAILGLPSLWRHRRPDPKMKGRR